jgi:excisionase family DNA binding protein
MTASEQQLKMYSYSKAARLMNIGRDTLKKLIAQGLIGTVRIGKRNKITHAELIRFQTEKTVRSETITNKPTESRELWEQFFGRKKDISKQIDSKSLLDKIIRS